MKTYSRVTGAQRGWWTCIERHAGRRRAPWLLALLLLAGGSSVRAETPSKLVCPHPRDVSACSPAQGLPPSDCTVYEKNKDWLPPAYVINATCVCQTSVNDKTADCAHAKIQAQTLAVPEATREEGRLCNSKHGLERDECFEKHLTPLIHQIHVNAYTECCCPCGPSPYPSWEAVTVLPIKNCKVTGELFDLFGSCFGTPGKW